MVVTNVGAGVSGTGVRSVVGKRLLAITVEQGIACTCWTLLFLWLIQAFLLLVRALHYGVH